MYARLLGERHYCKPVHTFVGMFRLKAWQFMDYVAHNCVEECEVRREDTIISYDKEFVKALRMNRFPEWIQWEPDEDDFARWELYVQGKKEQEEAQRIAALEDELYLQQFQRELEEGVWKHLGGDEDE